MDDWTILLCLIPVALLIGLVSPTGKVSKKVVKIRL